MEKNSSTLRTILKKIIRFYQKAISPWFPAKCRYYPSCSEYAIDALNHHGTLKGCWLSLKRILRCHPFSQGGFDPVPNSSQSNIEKKEN